MRKAQAAQAPKEPPLPIQGLVRGLAVPQDGQGRPIALLGKGLPGLEHALLVRRKHDLSQEIAHGLAQGIRQVLQRRHGGAGRSVLDLREHIAGDPVAAERPLGQSCLQPRLAQQLPHLQ